MTVQPDRCDADLPPAQAGYLGAGWNFACQDWADKLRTGQTPIAEFPIDAVEGNAAVRLYDELRLPDVIGQPRLADVGGDWFRDIIRVAFGSYDVEAEIRRIGEVFILVPKKNSKTTNAAALGLVCLLMNRRPNIQGAIFAPTQEVATICFNQMVGMIQADEYLTRRFKININEKTITDLHRDERTGLFLHATLKVQSLDVKVSTGGILAFAIIDELHVMGQMTHAARVIAQIRGGMITNPESLLVIITTQSDKPPAGVFKEELDYARGVRDGTITDKVRILPVLYEFTEAIQTSADKQWRNPDLWPMVLPNLGRSFTLPTLRALYAQARDKGIEAEAIWASQHLNIQIGLGLHTDRWIGADFWIGAADPGLNLDTILATSDVCTIGVDGGGMDDLFALAVIGRHAVTRRWQAWVRAWADPIVLERRKSIAPQLEGFGRDGDLHFGESTVHEAEAAEICARVFKAGLLPAENAIGLDAFGIAGLRDALAMLEVPDQMIVGIGQGYKLQQAVLTLPRKLKDRSLRHGGQPIMAWCVGNAKAQLRGSNTVITKEAAGVAKIDPLVALFNAAILMFANPQTRTASYLDTEELMVF